MSIQYRDDSFSETLPIKEAMKRLNFEVENNFPIKAFHVGTPSEIEKVKEKQELTKRMDELEEKVKELSPIKTTLILPTEEEIRALKSIKKELYKCG